MIINNKIKYEISSFFNLTNFGVLFISLIWCGGLFRVWLACLLARVMKYDGRVRVAVIVTSILAVAGLFFVLNFHHSSEKKPFDQKAVKAAKKKVHKMKSKFDTKGAAPSAAEMKAFNRVADEVADGKFLDELLALTPEAACDVFIYEFGVKGVMVVTKHVDEDGDHVLPKFQGAPNLIAEHAAKSSVVTAKTEDDQAALLHHHHKHHFDDDKHISLFCKSFQKPEVGRTIRVAKSVKYPADKYIIEMIQ